MITIHWPKELKFGDETKRELPTADKIREWFRDEWLEHWLVRTTSARHRNELVLQVPYLGEFVGRFELVKRSFALLGITPDVEVDGEPLIKFAWRTEVESIHRRSLLDVALRALKKYPAMDATNEAARETIKEELNKLFPAIEAELVAELKGRN
jgi:hypothetical protein